MMDIVDELVIQPFREVVEKGKQAVANANANENARDCRQDMIKEAERLVKVGERGLSRIETSCRKLHNEYGNAFIIALKENDEITECRKQLTDLLWDFEDYIDPDTFDAVKFQELQALNREAAPKVYNLLITMKLEASSLLYSQLSPPSSPHPSTLSPIQPTPQHSFPLIPSPQASMAAFHTDAPSVVEHPEVKDATTELLRLISSSQLSEMESHVPQVTLSAGEQQDMIASPSEQPIPAPPRPPSADAWDPHASHYLDDGKWDDQSLVDQRSTIFRSESPVDPALSPVCSISPQGQLRGSEQSFASVVGMSDNDTEDYSDYRHSGSSTQSSFSTATSIATSRSKLSTLSPTIPEEGILSMSHGPRYNIQPLQLRPFLPPLGRRVPSGSVTRRVEDMGRQYEALRKPPSAPLPSPPPSRHYGGVKNSPTLSPRSGTSIPRGSPGLDAASKLPKAEMESGLIPVEPEAVSAEAQVILSKKDCTIGPSSTFFKYKGFCEGAKEVVRGEIGVKKTKRPGFSTATTVAKCTGCLFELDFSQIEADVNKEDKGNFYKSGINYRLRFLQKSHLAARRVDDVLYACVFCVRAGRTVDESDATVFTNSKALFHHLSHHPRPLPEVPGIAVLDGGSIPAHLRNDYDIHFLEPPAAHAAQLNVSQIVGKATGVAKDQSRKLYGQRLLFDRSPALELCHGAKLTGIDWPEKHKGEWIFAWHDGVYASAPADIIKLDPPAPEDIKMGGSSIVRAKARWKFQQKDKEKDKSLWLKFDKNEAITNISYPYPEFWCWSGTNAKGKWGIFPKAFLEPCTIQELKTEGSDRASTLSSEKNKPSSVLSKFSSSKKRVPGRPPSIAESTSSRETLASQYSSSFSRGNFI